MTVTWQIRWNIETKNRKYWFCIRELVPCHLNWRKILILFMACNKKLSFVRIELNKIIEALCINCFSIRVQGRCYINTWPLVFTMTFWIVNSIGSMKGTVISKTQNCICCNRGKSMVCKRKSGEDKIDPWGTPGLTRKTLERVLFITTGILQPERKLIASGTGK